MVILNNFHPTPDIYNTTFHATEYGNSEFDLKLSSPQPYYSKSHLITIYLYYKCSFYIYRKSVELFKANEDKLKSDIRDLRRTLTDTEERLKGEFFYTDAHFRRRITHSFIVFQFIFTCCVTANTVQLHI